MEKDIYKKAKERVKKKKAFHKQLTSFFVWGVVLLFINVFWARGYFWSLWVILFWGLAVLKQAVDVYGLPWKSEDWEEKEIQKEVKRMKNLDKGQDKSDFPEMKQKEEEKSEEESPDKSWNDRDLV